MPHSYLVPDEYTWSTLTTWLVEGKDLTKFDGYDKSPFYGAQSLVVPSAWQVEFLNISSLNAVRSTSLLYGIGSLLVFFCAIKLITQSAFSGLTKKQFIFAMGILLTYGLMPSHLFWSLVGLRDSASEFFVLLTLFFVCKSLFSKKWRWYALPLVGLFSIISFSARAQTAWVLCALVSIIGITSIFTKAKRPELIALGIAAFFMGQFISEIPEKVLTKEVVITQGSRSITLTFEDNKLVKQKLDGLSLEAKDGKLEAITSVQLENSNSTEGFSELNESTLTLISESIGDAESGSINTRDAESGLKTTFKVTRGESGRTNVIQGAGNPINKLENLENERTAKRLDAESSFSGPECNSSDSNSLVFSLCIVGGAIYQFFSFLFRPLIIETATSLEFTFAAYENLLWLAIFASVLFFWLKLRWRPNQLDLIPLFFFALFAPAAAMTQGNLGTAMRHKSIVLWAFLWIALSIYFYHQKNIATRQVASEIDR